MNGISATVLAVGLAVAPVCAAGVVLVARRPIALGLVFGTFVGAGLTVGAGLGAQVGLGIIVVGLVTTLILASGPARARSSAGTPGRSVMPQGTPFRLAAALLAASAAWGLAVQGGGAGAPVSIVHLGSAAIVLAMGLLMLGLSQDKESAAMGLLVSLAGFEMAYAFLEPSLAMRAVLAAVAIGISFVANLDPEIRTPARGEERREK